MSFRNDGNLTAKGQWEKISHWPFALKIPFPHSISSLLMLIAFAWLSSINAQFLPIIPQPKKVIQFPNATLFNWNDQLEIQLIGTDSVLLDLETSILSRIYEALPKYSEDALIPAKPYYVFAKTASGEIISNRERWENASKKEATNRISLTYRLTINPELLPIKRNYLEHKRKGPLSWLKPHSPSATKIKLVLHAPTVERMAKTDASAKFEGTWKIEDEITNFIPQVFIHRESYVLKIGSGKQPMIQIHALDFAGLCWGLGSLRQLSEHNKTGSIVPMQIEDYPEFPYRGMHLDVSRHFFSVDEIKRYIDHLSFYKINTFHWHLCDDQGWRIEIKKYPKLTEIGAWRMNRDAQNWRLATPQEPGEIPNYGGYYTQENIRDVVKYAKERGVSIVPEIEMPGHSSAALAAYPNLSCSKLPQFVVPGGNYPKTNSSVFCAGNEATFAFLEDVLDLYPYSGPRMLHQLPKRVLPD